MGNARLPEPRQPADALPARSLLPAVREKLIRLDRWFHAEVEGDIRLARSFTLLHFAGPFFGLGLCAMLWSAGTTPDWVLGLFAFCVTLFWTLPLVVRGAGEVEGPAFASVQLLVQISLFLSYHHGGLNSPFAVWLVVATLLSFLFTGRLTGWCLAVMAAQIAVFHVTSGDAASRPPVDEAALGTLFAASVMAATFYISFIAVFYARIKTEGSALAMEAREHRQLSARLHATISAASKDDRRRSAYLSRVSHELRTLLNVVIGYSEMLLEDALAEERRDREQRLRSVMQSSRVLLAFVEDGSQLAQSDLEESAQADDPFPGEPKAAAGPQPFRWTSARLHLAAGLRQALPVAIGLAPYAAALIFAWASLAMPDLWPGSNLAFILLASGAVLLCWTQNRSAVTAAAKSGNSDRDELTGLLNRQAFQGELDRSIQARPEAPVALLFADLDGFKEVNDSLGHNAGDQLLRKVAERFAAAALPGTLLGRLGGDELGAALVGDGAKEKIQALADAWLDALALPIETEEDFLSVGVSIGIADGRAGAIGSRELLRRSDVAMYRAKSDKRQPVQTFDLQMDEALSFRRTMRQDLASAIREDQLQLVLQPVVNARSGEVASAEALLRWTHPLLGPVSPAKLIPLAEESGQITSLDDWVLERALQYAQELPNLPIAVNVSPIQFRHPGLARKIVDRLDAYSVPASRLRLEITEGVLVTHTRAANRTILELREAGIGVALDDFGTGYSSLSYLKDFQFDFLKIDRSFLSDLHGGRTGAELLRAIVDLGHSLGTRVIAEGVENAAQASIIQLLGCDFIQGYFTGRPTSFEAFRERLAEKPARLQPVSTKAG